MTLKPYSLAIMLGLTLALGIATGAGLSTLWAPEPLPEVVIPPAFQPPAPIDLEAERAKWAAEKAQLEAEAHERVHRLNDELDELAKKIDRDGLTPAVITELRRRVDALRKRL